MARLTSFERRLDRLFHDRTYALRSSLGLKRPGPHPKMTRKRIDHSIAALQDLSSSIMAGKIARKEFKENARPKKGRKITGWGWKQQQERFENWFKQKFPNQKDLVYVFWNREKCVYVGRTGAGGSRPSSHFNKKWCHITRVDVYPTGAKSQTPKLECLAVHRFEPSQNNYKPSAKKCTKKCPLCAIHKEIERELRKIFRIR